MLHQPKLTRSLQSEEQFPADLHELLMRFEEYRGARPDGPLLIDRAYEQPGPDVLHSAMKAALRGLTAAFVTLALFAGGVSVMTAPAHASVAPLHVELA